MLISTRTVFFGIQNNINIFHNSDMYVEPSVSFVAGEKPAGGNNS